MKAFFRFLAGALGFPIGTSLAWAQSFELPTIELTAGIYRLEAEVAATPATRMQGLMHRRVLPAQRGMLFVFPTAARHCMWMKNTYLPLSVAFLDEDGTIVNIEDMKPRTEDDHCARVPVRYALEMNRGWFAQRGIQPGDRLAGLEKAPAAQ